MRKKKKNFFCSSMGRALLVMLLLALGMFAGFTMHDRRYLSRTLDVTFDFMQNRVESCERYTANDEAKSLVRLLDKTTELSRVMGALGGPNAEVLQQYAEEQRLTGAVLLNEEMQPDARVGSIDAAGWAEFFRSSVIREIAVYPEKVYLSRTEHEGLSYDVAAVTRRDAPGVVVCFFRQDGEVQNGDFSPQNLFAGITVDMHGVVVLSDGTRVVSSNDERLQGLTIEQCCEMGSGGWKADRDGVVRLTGSMGSWYGSKKRLRNYDLYAFFPAAQVYSSRTIVMSSTLAVMMIAWLVMLMQQGRAERETLEQSQKRLRIINALSTAYSAIMLVQLKDKTVEVYRSDRGNYENYSSPMTAGSQQEQIARMVAPEYQQQLKEFSDITTMARRLQGRDSLRFTWQMANGGWMTTLVVPQRYDDKGGLMAVLIANQDVTEEKQREQEAQRKLEKAAEDARRANAAKTDFLRRMSHDVRTPINGIQGMVEISRHCIGDEARQEDCRRKILDASSFLLELVNNVLDMNKLESGEIQLEAVPFDLQALVQDTNGIIEIQARERGVVLQDKGVDARHTHLIGSPVHLRQVLQNIASNAVKYTPEGGNVVLCCRELAAENGVADLEFTCADTGIGMSEEFQARAFEPFAQEDANARTAYSGTGLGLAITHELVERMGGTITFKSAQGKGTTFTIHLPLRINAAASAPQPEKAQAQPGSVQGARVLLVEDNDLNMEIAQFVLESSGAKVTQAWNGREAVDIFAASEPGSFDVILMDVMMPVMGGLEAARTIRAMQRPDAASVPIFAMTANAFQDDICRSRAAGMNEHLTKPLDAKELLAAIARYRK